MARIIKVDGRTFIPPDWRELPENKGWHTVMSDNRRERADVLPIMLQARADQIASQIKW